MAVTALGIEGLVVEDQALHGQQLRLHGRSQLLAQAGGLQPSG